VRILSRSQAIEVNGVTRAHRRCKTGQVHGWSFSRPGYVRMQTSHSKLQFWMHPGGASGPHPATQFSQIQLHSHGGKTGTGSMRAAMSGPRWPSGEDI